MEKNETNETIESNYRINIKQTSKGFHYYDVSVRGQTKKEVESRLNDVLAIAINKCNSLNKTNHETQ